MHCVARLRFSVGTILLAASLIPPAQAATPRDEVLRLVPTDIGFCLVIQNVRDHAAALEASPFADQFRKSAAGQWLKQAADLNKLLLKDRDFKENFGLSLTGLRDELLGDAVVFAYRPGKPEEEQYLILIRARTEEVMTKVITTLNRSQKESGELEELEERNHKGAVYYRRVEIDLKLKQKKERYYFQHGPVLAYSSSELLLKQALDLDRAPPANGDPMLTKVLRQLGADKALLAFYVNPRAFDPYMEKNVCEAKGAEAVFLKTFLVYWKALDGLCVSLTLDRDAILAVGMSGDSAKLPAAAQQFISELSKPGTLWKQVPEDALLVVGGRIDFAAFAKALGEFMTSDSRKNMHDDLNRLFVNVPSIKDVVKEVLPFLGPDVGLVLTAAADNKQLVPEGLFALRVQPGDKAPVDQMLLNQLNLLANFAVFAQPPPFKPLELKTMTFGKQEVKFLDSATFPAGVKPAFALKDGFLIIAGSPDLIRRFAAAVGPPADGPVPLVRVSFKAMRGYLATRRELLAKTVAEMHNFPKEHAAEGLDTVMAVLEFLDQLDVRLQTGKGQAVLSLVLRPAQPLRK